MQRDRQDNGKTSDTLLRVSAIAGAAVALLFAARRQSPSVWTGAAALALPLATRGITGHWPLEETVKGSDPVEVRATFTIMRPAVDIYDRWRRLEDLPSILRHVKEVHEGEDGHSHWRAGTPAGDVEWDAEIVEDRRPEVLRWQSLPGSEVAHEGRLTLRPWRGGEGTQMDVRIRVGGGASHHPDRDEGAMQVVRQAVAALVRPALEQEVVEDIRRFKSLLEAGEIPTTEGQSSGERKGVDLPNPF